MCASILYLLKIETQMDDKQVCVSACVCARPCVCSYRINPQYTMENNREQSIIMLHQMQSIFPQLSPFSFFSEIPANLLRFLATVILNVCQKYKHNPPHIVYLH